MVNFKSLDLAKDLKVKPRTVIHYLKLSLGKKVCQGDLLAIKKGFLGRKREIFSPVEGILDKLEETTGKLIIKELLPEKEKPKPVIPASKKVKDNMIEGVFGFGKSKGKLIFLTDNLKLKDLKKDLEGKLVGSFKIESLGVIFKAAALGINGLITAQLKEKWSLNLTQIKEDLGMAFLALSFDQPEGDFLKKLNQKEAILNGEDRVLEILNS